MNLPNKITLVRIVLIPLFMLIVGLKLPYGDYLATVVFVIAALTDTLDGYLARRRQEVTRFGKLLDPLADKLLVSAALLVLVEGGPYSVLGCTPYYWAGARCDRPTGYCSRRRNCNCCQPSGQAKPYFRLSPLQPCWFRIIPFSL